MMTRRKRWSTSAGSGWPQGQSLVVQVSGGARRAQAASTRQSRSNPNFRGNRVDTIFRAGLRALLFFSRWFERTVTHAVHTAADVMAPTNPIQHSFELAAERCEDLT